MSKNPARLGDPHKCPKKEPVKHGDGHIASGDSTVIFQGQPVARAGDTVKCQDGSTTTIQEGNACVVVNGKRLALVGDGTEHGGTIESGADSIHVAEGKPFVFIGPNVTIGKNVYFGFEPHQPDKFHDQHFILRHDKTGEPLPFIPYRLTTAKGKVYEGETDEQGKTQRIFTGETAESIKIELLYEGGEHQNDEDCRA